MRAVSKIQVTIAAGTSLSDAADLRFTSLVGINMSSAWDGVVLTFQASEDGLTFRELCDINGWVVGYFAPDEQLAISPVDFLSVRYVKVRSGTLDEPVNQSADRVLEIITRELD